MKSIYKICALIMAVTMILCPIAANGEMSITSEMQEKAENTGTAAELSELGEYLQLDEETQQFLNNTFKYDSQKEITPNVLLVDYYEPNTRCIYTSYLEKREVDLPEYIPMPFEIAEHIYITVPAQTEKIENISEGRTTRCKIVRYTFEDGLTPYEQAALFADNPQVRSIVPEYSGEDNVDDLIQSRPYEELNNQSLSESAGLIISEECWEWITDHCTASPPYSMSSQTIGFCLSIKCYDPICVEDYFNNEIVTDIRTVVAQEYEPREITYYRYYVDLKDGVNYFEGASLFFNEGNNILIIDVEYLFTPDAIVFG